MDNLEIDKAYNRYRAILRLPRNFNSFNKFLNFLGATYPDVPESFINTEEVKRKVHWLNGPHAQAMYKAWAAQNPDKVDWP